MAIANDPSNEARALNLLQTVGLIELKPGHKTSASTLDIIKNPKQLQFVELDAAQLPRSLDDVAMAAINVTFAIPAGLTPADAILIENKHSPYANIIVVRQQDANSAKLNQLVKAYQSEPVMQAAQRIFGNSALPAW